MLTKYFSGIRFPCYAYIEYRLFAGLPIETCPIYMVLCNRWFCVESGSAGNPAIILIHGFPSQVSLLW